MDALKVALVFMCQYAGSCVGGAVTPVLDMLVRLSQPQSLRMQWRRWRLALDALADVEHGDCGDKHHEQRTVRHVTPPHPRQ
jgi:hypothetical protein